MYKRLIDIDLELLPVGSIIAGYARDEFEHVWYKQKNECWVPCSFQDYYHTSDEVITFSYSEGVIGYTVVREGRGDLPYVRERLRMGPVFCKTHQKEDVCHFL